MNNIYIELEEAKKIVEELEKTHKLGFTSSQAVLQLYGEISKGWIAIKFHHLIVKAHPTDPNLNWGWSKVHSYSKFVDGKLVDFKDLQDL